MGWRVDIDQPTYQKYQTIPAGPLRALIDASIVVNPQGKEGKKPPSFAQVKMPPSLQCPFHNAERLCQIQVEHGEAYLSSTCATFPRNPLTIDHIEESALTLSCPEAARLVLLNPALLAADDLAVHHDTWEENAQGGVQLSTYFWPIREFTISLVNNRKYPLWQRLFLLGTFSRRLQGIVDGEIARGIPTLLQGFSAAVASGSLRASIETISADLTLQLGMVLELVKLRTEGEYVSARLVESVNSFAQGVGYGPGKTLGDLSSLYAEAYRLYYAPFFLKHPHILENYLVNMIFRKLFPLGQVFFEAEAKAEPAKEFAMLAIEFALVKGLLIGVAGCYKKEFSTQNVIQTVQTACKHFEHNQAFLTRAYGLLVEKKLDNAHGLTMLLRN